MDSERSDSAFRTEGAVVEILERGGERIARIVLAAGTVVEAAIPRMDIHLGDRVIVDATMRVTRVQGRADMGDGPLETRAAAGRSGGPAGEPAGIRFRDYEHVVRMAIVFVLGIALFLVWRAWMVPPDFGVYGHYRAGAIADGMQRPLRFAGQASCIECHQDVQEVRTGGRHARVACEACHGPLGQHARGEIEAAPVRPSPRAICITCHAAREGKPKAFPQVVVQEHSDAGPCTECHKAHAPGVS
jgi:hypothetical protein